MAPNLANVNQRRRAPQERREKNDEGGGDALQALVREAVARCDGGAVCAAVLARALRAKREGCGAREQR